jgi:hypothetical protein
MDIIFLITVNLYCVRSQMLASRERERSEPFCASRHFSGRFSGRSLPARRADTSR